MLEVVQSTLAEVGGGRYKSVCQSVHQASLHSVALVLSGISSGTADLAHSSCFLIAF